MNQRKSVMFSNRYFCAIWAVLWEILPFYSVFLVGVLSINRLILLIKPNKTLKAHVLISTLLTYLVILVLSKVVPFIIKISAFIYSKSTMYCFVLEKEVVYLLLNTISSSSLLAAPIIPIMVCCFYTIYKLRTQKTFERVSIEATKTVIMITAVYIVYNLPVFIKYVNHLVFIFSVSDHVTEYKEYYRTKFMIYYGWMLSYVFCVVLNSLSNPIIYFTRMVAFRKFMLSRLSSIAGAD